MMIEGREGKEKGKSRGRGMGGEEMGLGKRGRREISRKQEEKKQNNHLLKCASHYSRLFIEIILFNPDNNHVKIAFVSAFHRWGIQLSQKLNNLVKLTYTLGKKSNQNLGFLTHKCI